MYGRCQPCTAYYTAKMGGVLNVRSNVNRVSGLICGLYCLVFEGKGGLTSCCLARENCVVCRCLRACACRPAEDYRAGLDRRAGRASILASLGLRFGWQGSGSHSVCPGSCCLGRMCCRPDRLDHLERRPDLTTWSRWCCECETLMRWQSGENKGRESARWERRKRARYRRTAIVAGRG